MIKIHNQEDFEGMRVAGKLAAACLDMLESYVVVGVTTDHLDTLAREFILDNNAIPACLGYRGYPKTICTSINHVVCHGIPSDKKLHDGDILNIDVTVIVNGWHGDTSRMYTVGDISVKAKKIIDVTYEAFKRGLEVVKPGATIGDIGYAIQSYAESQKCSVVRSFVGHGVGKIFHDDPVVPHFGKPHEGIILQPGMFFTIEPMINTGKSDTKILSDGWTVVTKDKSLSAQFEHSIGVTETGYEVFTTK